MPALVKESWVRLGEAHSCREPLPTAPITLAVSFRGRDGISGFGFDLLCPFFLHYINVDQESYNREDFAVALEQTFYVGFANCVLVALYALLKTGHQL